jgi:hypothetical protein
MDEKLTKSLTDLIDETLQELDELRKSRFAASEIKIEGPGDGIAGKPSDGDLHAKKAEDDKKDDESEDKKEDEAKKGENEEAAKGENEEAAKAEDKKEDKEDDKKADKEPHKDDPEHEEKEKKIAKKLLDMHKGEMKKSAEESESLMKSYVEERVKPLEDKLSTILDLVNKIADQPVAPKGVTARVTPLLKSADEQASEPLSKAEVANKLFELKKSGAKVDSNDIVKAEMGQDLKTIVKKYEIS